MGVFIMATRYTIEQLKNMDDISFAISILQDRKSQCTNYYSPLSQKLSKSINSLCGIKNTLPNKSSCNKVILHVTFHRI